MKNAFTLIEMLVVLFIVSTILIIATPRLKTMLEGHAMQTAGNQLSSDISYARHYAIAHRTPTIVVFLDDSLLTMDISGYSISEKNEIERLKRGAYTQYALFSFRSVGDQPGKPNSKYIGPWKTLPNKTFLAKSNFERLGNKELFYDKFCSIPFPFATSRNIDKFIRYIAFNSEGNISRPNGDRIYNNQNNVCMYLASGHVSFDDYHGVIYVVAQEMPMSNSVNTPNIVKTDIMTGKSFYLSPLMK